MVEDFAGVRIHGLDRIHLRLNRESPSGRLCQLRDVAVVVPERHAAMRYPRTRRVVLPHRCIGRYQGLVQLPLGCGQDFVLSRQQKCGDSRKATHRLESHSGPEGCGRDCGQPRNLRRQRIHHGETHVRHMIAVSRAGQARDPSRLQRGPHIAHMLVCLRRKPHLDCYGHGGSMPAGSPSGTRTAPLNERLSELRMDLRDRP